MRSRWRLSPSHCHCVAEWVFSARRTATVAIRLQPHHVNVGSPPCRAVQCAGCWCRLVSTGRCDRWIIAGDDLDGGCTMRSASWAMRVATRSDRWRSDLTGGPWVHDRWIAGAQSLDRWCTNRGSWVRVPGRATRRAVRRCMSMAGDARFPIAMCTIGGSSCPKPQVARCESVAVSAVSRAVDDGSWPAVHVARYTRCVSAGRQGPIVWHENAVSWTQRSVALWKLHDHLAALRGVHELPLSLVSIYKSQRSRKCSHASVMRASCAICRSGER